MTRIVAVCLHCIIFPIVSVIFMWKIFGKDSENRTCCNTLPECILTCNIARHSDDPEQTEIPQIISDSEKSTRLPTSNKMYSQNNMKIYCNCAYFGLVLLSCAIPLCYITSGATFIIKSITHLIDDRNRPITINFTRTDFIYDQAYAISGLFFYFFQFLIVPPLLVYTINVYLNVIYKCALLKQLLMENAHSDQLENIIKRILKLFQSPDDELNLKLASTKTYSSIYILDVIIFDALYILYLFIKDALKDPWRWTMIGFLGLSVILLVILILIADYHVEDLKRTLLLVPILAPMSKLTNTNRRNSSSEQRETPTDTDTTQQKNQLFYRYNITNLQTIINHYNPLVGIFGFAPRLTALTVIVTQLVTIFVPFALKQHGIIIPDKTTNSHLEMF